MGILNHQILAALLCNLGGCSTGMLVGWLSPALPQLMSPSRPVGEVTLEQSVWLAAVFPLPGLVAPLWVKISEVYGRKVCVIVSSIPFAINGLVILLATDVTTLTVGRLIGGFGQWMTFCNTPSYVAETADADVRGRMGSTFNLMYVVGVLTVYAVGGFVSYKAAAIVMIAVAMATFVLFMLMPETPTHLVRKGDIDGATKAIAWLKEAHPKSEQVRTELNHLRETLSVARLSTLEALRLLFTSRPLLYGFGMCAVTFVAQSMSGMFAIHGYSVTIFMDGGASNITPELAAVFYACIQLVGALSTSWLIDRQGRKVLLLASYIGVALSMYALAIYFYLNTHEYDTTSYRWMPILALCFCVYFYTIGAGGIPYILVSDLIHEQVRSVATMLVFQLQAAMGFMLMFFFEPISVAYGRHVIFGFFATCCLVAMLFTVVFLKETKGMSHHDIMDMHSGFKRTLVIADSSKKTFE